MPLTNRTERLLNEILIPAIQNLGGTIPPRTQISNLEEYQFALMSQFVSSLLNTLTQANLTAHTGNVNNPHVTTAAQVYAEPVGTFSAHLAAVDPHSQYATDGDLSNTNAFLTSHTGNSSNPHATTAAQVGAATTTALTNHTASTSNPHATTAVQVGAEPSGAVATHAAIAANTHGLPASVNFLGNRNAAGEYLQRGSATASGSLGSLALAQYREIAVTFPNAFTSAPKVFCTSVSGYPAAVTTVSATGCTIRVFGELSFSSSTVVNYLAIGS